MTTCSRSYALYLRLYPNWPSGQPLSVDCVGCTHTCRHAVPSGWTWDTAKVAVLHPLITEQVTV